MSYPPNYLALTFELSEYTVNKREGKKVSQLFKEIVRYGEEEHIKPVQQRIRKARYDRTDVNGNIIPTYPIETAEVEKEHVEPPTLEEDKEFDLYMGAATSSTKRHLLMYALKLVELSDPTKDAKTAIRAITRCIASDEDKDVDRMLKQYLKKCRSDG